MIRVRARSPEASGEPASRRRRKFGLDAPLPADTRAVERAILRHLREERPSVVALAMAGDLSGLTLARGQKIALEAGVPDLLLLLPGGRLACLKIKTQAEDLTPAHRAFADLCRERGIPFAIVRSLPEARQALDRLAL